MKMRLLNVPVMALASCFLVWSCTAGTRKGRIFSETSSEKQIYASDVNEVEVFTLTFTEFHRQVISSGRLNASRKTALSFASSGTVVSISVHNGQYVKRGQVIARLDAEDRQLKLNSAQIAFEKSQVDLLDVLVGLGYQTEDMSQVPPDILDLAKIRSGWKAAENSLKIAERAFEESVLKAPFSGRIADLSSKIYDQVGTSPFCTLLEDSNFDVVFPVLETEMSVLKNASEVKVIPYSSTNGIPVAGKIENINPTIGKNGQIMVRATVRGESSLMDGMSAKIIIEETVPDRLVVPKRAVVIRDNQDVLFRYDSGKAEWVYVKILESSGDFHSVIANAERGATLGEGDTVIVSGNLNLADGSKVRIKP